MRDIGYGKCKRSWCQTAAINEAGLCYEHADELLTDLAHVPKDPDDPDGLPDWATMRLTRTMPRIIIRKAREHEDDITDD